MHLTISDDYAIWDLESVSECDYIWVTLRKYQRNRQMFEEIQRYYACTAFDRNDPHSNKTNFAMTTKVICIRQQKRMNAMLLQEKIPDEWRKILLISIYENNWNAMERGTKEGSSWLSIVWK